jgi:excisionase family DNA binding protein
MMRDADFGSVRIRAYGTYDFHVVNQKLFLEKVAGTVGQFLLDDFAETMLSRIVSVFSDTLAAEKLAVLDIASQYQVLGDKLLPKLNEAATSRYGIELRSFVIENISLPEDVAQAIDKRSSMAAVGNLNDYMKFEMAEGLSKGKGSGIAATAAQLGAGLVMGQQMGQAIGAAGVPSLLSPSEAAKILGVSESDVLTALGDGSLKGKKIGTSWRITQQSLDEFLKD